MEKLEKGKLTKDQRYYLKKKQEAGYLENRREWQREYRKNNPDYDASVKQKVREYYEKNKETINKKGVDCISDSYVKKLFKDKDISEIDIELKRNEILIYRINKQIKQKQDEL